MRYFGGGIGHMNQDSCEVPTEASGNEMNDDPGADSAHPLENNGNHEADYMPVVNNDEEGSTSSASSQSSNSSSESESDSDSDDEINFGPEDKAIDEDLPFNFGFSTL